MLLCRGSSRCNMTCQLFFTRSRVKCDLSAYTMRVLTPVIMMNPAKPTKKDITSGTASGTRYSKHHPYTSAATTRIADMIAVKERSNRQSCAEAIVDCRRRAHVLNEDGPSQWESRSDLVCLDDCEATARNKNSISQYQSRLLRALSKAHGVFAAVFKRFLGRLLSHFSKIAIHDGSSYERRDDGSEAVGHVAKTIF